MTLITIVVYKLKPYKMKTSITQKYVDSIKDLKQDFLAFKQEAPGIINVLNDLDAQLSELKQKQIDLENTKMTKSRNWLVNMNCKLRKFQKI